MDTPLSKYLCRCFPVIDNFSMRWKALLTILIWCACNEKFNIFSRFPFYYEVKILLLIWLISPVSRGSLGSSILYRRFVHPSLIAREEVWFWLLFSIFRGFLRLFWGSLSGFLKGWSSLESSIIQSYIDDWLYISNCQRRSMILYFFETFGEFFSFL